MSIVWEFMSMKYWEKKNIESLAFRGDTSFFFYNNSEEKKRHQQKEKKNIRKWSAFLGHCFVVKSKNQFPKTKQKMINKN